MYVCRNY